LNLRDKIKERLNGLQGMMERQDHLGNAELVTERLESVTEFWSTLSENDREFVFAFRFAIAEKRQLH
jgi:hypothetical protein